MPRRAPLPPPPPPPPPEHIRTWPGRDALLADRAAVLGDLVTRLLGVPRLLLFLLVVALLQLGWGFGAGLTSLGHGLADPPTLLVMVFGGAIGVGIMVAGGLAAGSGIRRDRRIRELLAQWASLDRDPAGDARFRAPGPSLCWFLVSFAVGAFGLWLSFATPATARPGSSTYGEVAYLMGVGAILWVAGLIGAAKAVALYRWAVRLTTAAPSAKAPGGVHR
ncbi:hypothetical protein [Streptomyces sp. NPDC059909]|uniref:hypothetical protein n=1 Tax=Streptomyces sp. NPDC059909 TaxID=3346998 RepID=UPI003647C24E